MEETFLISYFIYLRLKSLVNKTFSWNFLFRLNALNKLQIVRGCSGSPLALRVSGRSLSQQHQVVWHNRARELSRGGSILHSSDDVLECLKKCFDLLDPKGIECFKDLGSFPEDQRIPAAVLVDMWTELYGDDDASALENIYQLVNWNMADIVVTRYSG